MVSQPAFPISIDDIEAAARRITGEAVRTPLLRFPALDELTGGRILIKPEMLQRTGSFKFRGAYNALSSLSDNEKKAGVVAWSSGNHAQGVALAGRLLGIPTVIVMPADAPQPKIAATRSYGAEVVTYDRWSEDREAIGRKIAADRGGAAIIPPFDDVRIIAGQGTVGLEIAADAKAMGLALDEVVVNVSGGGLIAGVATGVQASMPSTKVFAAEPEGFDDHARSLRAGERLKNPSGASSICDALLSPVPGEITFTINSRRLAGGYVVSDEEVLQAMAYAFRTMKLVVEPGGAVSLAALLSGKISAKGRTIALVLSGGNVDPEQTARALAL
ncbi:threonine/serine dehydratase [Lacibacterium aquatile]|uniref:Threonine/serine dehydratase n=1 Tax=Lacibacterium aquatile TaxID=1168082 RepID=A0ABW5DLA6_9PROT